MKLPVITFTTCLLLLCNTAIYADPPSQQPSSPGLFNNVIVNPNTGSVTTAPSNTNTTSTGTRPPGWDRGNKTGWGNSNVPPGQAQKSGVPVNSKKHKNKKKPNKNNDGNLNLSNPKN